MDVYLNGIRLASGDFTATSGSTVVLAVGASVNDTVDIVSTGDGITFRSTSDSSGDRFTLNNLGIGTDQTPDALNVRGNVNIVGVLTATTLHGDGSNLTNTGSTLSEPSSGTQRLVTTSLTTGTMTSSGTGSELAFDYANNRLNFTDNTAIALGTGTDLLMYHDGSNSVIRSGGTGQLQIESSNNTSIVMGNAALSETIFRGTVNGAVQLFYDNSQKLGTAGWGVQIQGILKVLDATDANGSTNNLSIGAGNDLKLYHTGTNNHVDSVNGALVLR